MRKMFVLLLVLTVVFTWSGWAMAKGGPPPGKGHGKSNAAKIVNEEALAEDVTEDVAEDVEMGQEEGLQEDVTEGDIEDTEETGRVINGKGQGREKALQKARERLQKRMEKMQAKFERFQSRMTVRGRGLNFDVPPVIFAGRTLIPVRAITNGLGATVEWDAETQTITISRDGKTIILALDSAEVTVDGETVTLDVPAQLISNRTFVPLRFISETLGEKVEWDPETGDINIGDEDASSDGTEEDEAAEEETGDVTAPEEETSLEDNQADTGEEENGTTIDSSAQEETAGEEVIIEIQ